jgi:predicted phosphodiesterase
MTRLLKLLALLVLAVVVAVPTAYATFVHSERPIVIGAHEATVQPDFTGHARIDFGPLLPRVRVPTGAPLGIGVDINLGDSDVTDLNELVARDAVIASQPQGEIAAVRSTIVSMAVDALLRAAGAALLAVLVAVLAWRAVGRDRRRVLRERVRHPGPRQVAGALATSLAVVAGVALLVVPERPHHDSTSWVPLRTAFPQVPSDRVLDTVEIADGASTAGGKALVEGALETYQSSVSFYGKLALQAATVEVREPLPGQTTALVVTDRHDNIGMDPVARAIASQARADTLIDLGDDTSTGASWESFSINSLAREFDGFDVVAVAGNHDTGPNVRADMLDKGFEVMDGEPVDVGGIRYLGASDPRSSGLTAGYSGDPSDNSAAIREQDAALTKVACEDGEVDVIVVHSPSSAKQAAASGCVDLVLSGHLHRQVGPETVQGANGRPTVTLSTASSGGAVYAFALGSKLRRVAQVTIVTFEDGKVAGLQPVSFQPGGIIEVADFLPITPGERTSD